MTTTICYWPQIDFQMNHMSLPKRIKKRSKKNQNKSVPKIPNVTHSYKKTEKNAKKNKT